MRHTRALGLILLVALTAAACAPDDSPGSAEAEGVQTTGPDAEPTTPEERLARIRKVTGGACTPARNAGSYLAGIGLYCVPFDSIPAVDEPSFVPLERAELPAVEPVAVIEIAGEHRAYPIRYMSTHEIVNDVVRGRPIAVTFCPLCNSAVGFDREVEGRTLTFGVSGQLLSGNLVMFDRETISLWQQASGRAFNGGYRGTELEPIPVQLVSFGGWRRSHPEGKVMEAPADDFDYSVDPYAGYALNPNQESKFFRPPPESGIAVRTDPRLPPKWRVVGVERSGSAVAFAEPADEKRSLALAVRRLKGVPLVAFFKRDTAKTSSARRFEDSDRGWSGTVWIARAGGRDLDLAIRDGGFFETATGSRFNLFGRAVSGPLEGTELRAIDQMTAFWFSWVDTHPDTKLVRGR